MSRSESTAWLDRAWASPSIGAARLDETGRVTSVNPAFDSWSEDATLIGRPLASMIAAGQSQQFIDLFEAGELGEKHIDVGMFPDAHGIPVDVRISVAPHPKGLGFVALIEPYRGAQAGAMTDILKLNERLAETQREISEKNRALEAALKEVKASSLYIRKLEGILPICMTCKSVRNDDDEWVKLDRYLSREGGVSVSHGLCPGCAEEMHARLDITP